VIDAALVLDALCINDQEARHGVASPPAYVIDSTSSRNLSVWRAAIQPEAVRYGIEKLYQF
jgi:hypothetical protein